MSHTLEHWRESRLNLMEAALLIAEQNPDDYPYGKALLEMKRPTGFTQIYRRLLEAATTIVDENVESDESGKTYIKYELTTNIEDGISKLSELDGLEIFVWWGFLRLWLKERGIKAKYFDDDSLINFETNIKLTSAGHAHANVSEQLSLLNQASSKFWANADRNDRDTHPLNSTVVDWLLGHNFSETLANKAATIIRPEWAISGRKPEK